MKRLKRFRKKESSNVPGLSGQQQTNIGTVVVTKRKVSSATEIIDGNSGRGTSNALSNSPALSTRTKLPSSPALLDGADAKMNILPNRPRPKPLIKSKSHGAMLAKPPSKPGTSFGSVKKINIAESIESFGDLSINDSATGSMASLASDVFANSANSVDFENMKRRDSMSNNLVKKFKQKVRRLSVSDRKKSSSSETVSPKATPPNKNSQQRYSTTMKALQETVQRYKNENESLQIELRGKDEELTLLNITMDQAVKGYEEKIKVLMLEVEESNRKAEVFQKKYAEATSHIPSQKPPLRIPFSPSSQQDDDDRASSENGSMQLSPPLKRRGVREMKKATVKTFEKTETVRERLIQALTQSKCMSQLSREEIQKLADVMKVKKINKGERLMQEQTIGRHMYVLADGECRKYKRNQESTSPKMGGGIPVEKWTLFGDMDLYYHTRRVWSCQCVTQGAVWYITREEFRATVPQQDRKRKNSILSFLRSTEAFQNLNNTQLIKLVNVSRIEHFGDGDYIIRQGGFPSSVYILKCGTAHVTRHIDGTESLKRVLSEGEKFGDDTIELRHHNNVIAKGNEIVQCVVIPVAEFDNIKDAVVSSQPVEGVSPAKNFLQRISRQDVLDSVTTGSSGYISDNSSSSPAPKKRVNKNFEFDKTHMSSFLDVQKDLKGNGKEDFQFLLTIGNGAFGSVDLVSSIKTKKVFAVKRLSKKEIVASEQQKQAFYEKNIQMQTSQECPFIASLFHTFKDNKYVYFVMEFCAGGDLFAMLKNAGSFNSTTSRFYTGCVVQALAYLHNKNIAYRDLKPENIVLDRNGYCKLTDFGFAKLLKTNSSYRTYTYCGTPEYMAPEVILYNAQTFSVDLWSLGVFIFEICSGKAPFRSKNNDDLSELILDGIEPKLKAANAANKIDPAIQHFIGRLCEQRPEERIGAGKNGFNEIMKHRWFKGFDWVALRQRTMSPPYKPRLDGAEDSKYFEPTKSRHIADEEELSGWDQTF